jgi:hypothetical protein
VRKTKLAAVAVLSSLVLASCSVASAATGELTDSQKLDKILANTEQIKQKLGIVDPPPTTQPTAPPTTVVPPPTTTQPPPTTTTPPPPVTGTAAGAFNWGVPLPQSDEFNYVGKPDTTKWDIAGECWPGHAGNGRRCASRSTVANGYLRETGLANGDTGWLASNVDLKTGRWEVRARMASDGGTGHAYHPVLITWPQSDEWPQGGEYDFMETDIGKPGVEAFMHHPTSGSVVQDEYSKTVDITQWHNYGFEWSTTGLTGYIDGVVWFHDTKAGIQAPGPMHLTIQLDDFYGSGMQPAHFDVDWARIYKS